MTRCDGGTDLFCWRHGHETLLQRGAGRRLWPEQEAALKYAPGLDEQFRLSRQPIVLGVPCAVADRNLPVAFEPGRLAETRNSVLKPARPEGQQMNELVADLVDQSRRWLSVGCGQPLGSGAGSIRGRRQRAVRGGQRRRAVRHSGGRCRPYRTPQVLSARWHARSWLLGQEGPRAAGCPSFPRRSW